MLTATRMARGALALAVRAACARPPRFVDIGEFNTTPGIKALDRQLRITASYAASGHDYLEATQLAAIFLGMRGASC